MSSTLGHVLAVLVIVLSGLYIFRWVFAPAMTFYDDDWTWLATAVAVPWSNFLSIWTLLPAALFHDRPLEIVIFKLLRDAFGWNHLGYAITILALHIANAVLLYALAYRLLSTRFYAMIAATLFVIDYFVAYPGWWAATVSDSASLFFCLSAFLAFLSPRRLWSVAGTVVLYWLAVKSKESAAAFPLLLFAYRFLADVRSARPADIGKALRAALRATWPVLVAFGVFIGFYVYYLVAARKGGMQGYGLYTPTFDVHTFVDSMGVYLGYIVFQLVSDNVALFGYLLLALLSLVIFDRVAILGAIGFFIAIGQGFFLPSHRSEYYAYPACAYIALMLAALASRADARLAPKFGPALDVGAKALVFGGTLWLAFHVYAVHNYRDYVLSVSREGSKALKSLIAAVDKVEERSKIVVTGVPTGAVTLLSNAPCNAINAVYNVVHIDCRIEGSDAELLKAYEAFTPPKMLLRYDRGDIALLARDP